MENQKDKEACPVTKQEFNDRLAFEAVYYGCDTQNLKSLENISDEDAIIYFGLLWDEVGNHKEKPIDFKIEYGKEWAKSLLSERYGLIPSGYLCGIDFLRSRGYLLPFRNYSIKQILSMGWAKYEH